LNQFSAGDHYALCAMEGDEIALSHSGAFVSVWNTTTSTSSNPFHFNALKLGYIGKNRVVIGGNNGVCIIAINGNEVSREDIDLIEDKVECLSVY
jgi:hypothetical protein